MLKLIEKQKYPLKMSRQQFRQDLIMLISAIALVLILGATTFHYLEGWSFLDAFYFVSMTATTVGYGDFTPSHGLSKIITIAYALSIIPFVFYAFSVIAKSQMERIYRRIHHLERKQKEQEQVIDAAERKIEKQKTQISEQEEELENQQKNIKKSIKAIKQTEAELAKQRKKLLKEHKINKEQEEEISEHDKELEVVEEIMEKELIKQD